MRPTVIGIVGQDRCGSTLAGRLLEALEGVRMAGELHWLVDAPPEGTFHPKVPGWPISRQCTVHGLTCKVIPKDFYWSLTASDEPTVYERVRHRLGARTIVSTDKYPGYFERFVKSKTMFGLLLWKAPGQDAASLVRALGEAPAHAVRQLALDYRRMMNWVDAFCTASITVYYEDLAKRPRATIEAVSKATGIPVVRPVQLISDYHSIGGNMAAASRLDVTLDTKSVAANDPEATATRAALLSRTIRPSNPR